MRSADLLAVRFGLVLGLLAVLYGWGLGIAFGAAETRIRARFIADGEASRALYLQKAGSDESATAAIKRMDEIAWRWFIRAHLHAGAIGSIAIGGSVLLALLTVRPVLKTIASVLLGVGSIGYPLSWMLAAMRAPALGSTAAAKESLYWLAVPASFGLVVGGLLTLGLVIADLFVRRSEPA